MCNVQTELQLVQQQEIAVLFSETTNRYLQTLVNTPITVYQ